MRFISLPILSKLEEEKRVQRQQSSRIPSLMRPQDFLYYRIESSNLHPSILEQRKGTTELGWKEKKT